MRNAIDSIQVKYLSDASKNQDAKRHGQQSVDKSKLPIDQQHSKSHLEELGNSRPTRKWEDKRDEKVGKEKYFQNEVRRDEVKKLPEDKRMDILQEEKRVEELRGHGRSVVGQGSGPAAVQTSMRIGVCFVFPF